jgi:hypothetical protein
MTLNEKEFIALGEKYGLKIHSKAHLNKSLYYWYDFPGECNGEFFFIEYEVQTGTVMYAESFSWNPYAKRIIGSKLNETQMTVEELEKVIVKSIKLYKEKLFKYELRRVKRDFA